MNILLFCHNKHGRMQHSLQEIKKELLHLDEKQLSELCLRLAKYKKENKELIAYLLFNADEPLAYAETVKQTLQQDFENLSKHYYYATKSLRKTLRHINKYAKYTSSHEVEMNLLLWFCSNFLAFADVKSTYKPLTGLFLRQLEKAGKLFTKLHEDLQFDYKREFDAVLASASEKIRSFDQKKFQL